MHSNRLPCTLLYKLDGSSNSSETSMEGQLQNMVVCLLSLLEVVYVLTRSFIQRQRRRARVESMDTTKSRRVRPSSAPTSLFSWLHFQNSRNEDDSSQEVAEYVPRPIYQRAALSGFILLGGLAFSAGLLLSRARVITRIRLQDNKVSIRTWSEWGSKDRIVDKHLCLLEAGGRTFIF